jgi:hypothetical protein
MKNKKACYLLFARLGLVTAICMTVTACSRPQYYVVQHVQSYSEFETGSCDPVFSNPMMPIDMADHNLGCATKANLRATMVHPSDLEGRYKFPLMEGNRGINPVSKLKGNQPDHASPTTPMTGKDGFDTSAKAPVAQAAQPAAPATKAGLSMSNIASFLK